MEYNENGYIIRISEEALIQMCLNGLEAYIIKHDEKKTPGLETYGLLWGHEILLPDKQTLYCVELLSIDTSAIREYNACTPEDSSLLLKRDLMTSFWPQYDFIGDFHTHPYSNIDNIEKYCYRFSKGDFNSIESYSDYWLNHKYRVGIVLTIIHQKNKHSADPKWVGTSAIKFNLGNYKLWIKGYVSYLKDKKIKLSDHDDENVILDCPSLIGLVGEYTKFGRRIKNIHKTGII